MMDCRPSRQSNHDARRLVLCITECDAMYNSYIDPILAVSSQTIYIDSVNNLLI